MSPAYRPLSPAALAAHLTDVLRAAEVRGAALRVAIDGPECAGPAALAEALVEPLRAAGRPTTVIRAESFWRDASLRLEYGREDVESYRSWLDEAALRREVLDPLGPAGNGRYLPSLRDPDSNRSTREPVRPARPGEIVVVAGPLLLGRDLPFDVTVHLALSTGARARRTPAAMAWTLPALDRYDDEVEPAAHADVTVRLDDPAHPAVADRTG